MKPEFTESRLIRPASKSSPEVAALELKLEDVQGLAEHLLREARERVVELESRARNLEASLAERWAEARAEGHREGLARGEAEGRASGREEGCRRGFEEGYAEGRRSGQREAGEEERTRISAEAAPLREVLERLVSEITGRRRAIVREARAELLPLALEIARKVVKREVRDYPEVVLLNVRKAIDLAFRRTALMVEVHPEDHRLLERFAPEVLRSLNGPSDVTLRSRDDVVRGGCRVSSGSGVVDLRIEAQLEVIEQALLGVLDEGVLDEGVLDEGVLDEGVGDEVALDGTCPPEGARPEAMKR